MLLNPSRLIRITEATKIDRGSKDQISRDTSSGHLLSVQEEGESKRYLFAPDERISSRRMDCLKPEKWDQIVHMIVKALTG